MTATSGQVRGMLLEEALLFLLKNAGYKTITNPTRGDRTLTRNSAGLQVIGRAVKHQIDAVADYQVTPPFAYPNRLLVEAKCYGRPVGIEVVRNALGVFQDIDEYWVPTRRSVPLKKRFHYQYAIATNCTFTYEAEKFAFAHDIYLIPLGRARYFGRVNAAIDALSDRLQIFDRPRAGDLRDLRMLIRRSLEGDDEELQFRVRPSLTPTALRLLREFIRACRRVHGGYMAVADGRFPVFLVPSPEAPLQDLAERGEMTVRISWDEQSWYIRPPSMERELFSFDLPDGLLKLYERGGILPAGRALDLKADNFSELQFLMTGFGPARLVTLRLDRPWLKALRQNIGGID